MTYSKNSQSQPDAPMKRTLTTCPYCGSGCSFFLEVTNNTITKVIPNKDNSVNKGSLCSKGHFGMDFVHSRDRLTTPLMRKNGTLTPVSWEEAYTHIASRLLKYSKENGPNSIAGFSSARCTNEENYLMQKMMRAVIGTNSVDHCARL
jgi:formate dehydrogenase major subunit